MQTKIEQNPKSRLIVLIPDGLAGNRDLAYKLNGMAQHEQRDLVYLALVDYEENSLSVSRSMATMKAVTSAVDLEVMVESADSSRWIESLRKIYRPEDVIICHAEQSVRYSPTAAGPLSEFIRDQLDLPVRTISGFYHPQKIQLKRLGGEVLYWLGFLVILGLFSALEIYLDRAVQGGMHTLTLVAALCVEFASILSWHDSRSKSR